MSKRIEDFIQKNKDAFNEHEPSEALWHRIERGLDNKNQHPAGKAVFFKAWMRVAAALVIVFTVAGIAWYIWNADKSQDTGAMVATADSAETGPDSAVFIPKEEQIALDGPQQDTHSQALHKEKKKTDPLPQKSEEDELYHYSRLIEIKQEQMETLKKSEPGLYQEFSKDMEMLATSYDALKAQLNRGVNREKLLEAMIGNLKMQSELLNRQLEILKQVRSKKENNEKNYKNL